MLSEERAEIYKQLSGYTKESVPGVDYFYDSKLAKLKESVSAYLECSLKAYYKRDFSVRSEDDLKKSSSEILSLPNITPNGLILPKNETAVFLNEVQSDLLDVLQDLDILRHIEKMMCVHVMIKTPDESKAVQDRPYYTGKIHSDAWVGHHGDAIFMSGLLGDVEGSTVEYFEPIDPKENFLDIADNFEDAKERYTSARFITNMKKSKFVVMDHLCLHRTKSTPNSGPRVSINFGVIMKRSNSKNTFDSAISRWKSSYFKPEDLRKVGASLTFFVSETLDQCEKKFQNFKGQSSVEPLPNNGIVMVASDNS